MAIATYSLVAAAALGSTRSGLAASVAVKVVDESNILQVAPTNTNVTESDVPGNYFVKGGLAVDLGSKGRILWSADAGATWIAEDPYDLAVIQSQLSDLLNAAGDDGVSNPGAV